MWQLQGIEPRVWTANPDFYLEQVTLTVLYVLRIYIQFFDTGILISWCCITVWYCCSHLVTECGVTQFWSAVGIAVATTAVVMFIAGTLAGALLFFCISKHRSQGLKSESSSFEQQQVALSSLQQQKAVSSPYLLKQTGPEYEDVIKLRQNAVYGITLTHTKWSPLVHAILLYM